LGAPDAVVNLAATPPSHRQTPAVRSATRPCRLSAWAKLLGCGVREQQVLAAWVEPTYLHREVKDDVS
jgi:hypothetical protein